MLCRITYCIVFYFIVIKVCCVEFGAVGSVCQHSYIALVNIYHCDPSFSFRDLFTASLPGCFLLVILWELRIVNIGMLKGRLFSEGLSAPPQIMMEVYYYSILNNHSPHTLTIVSYEFAYMADYRLLLKLIHRVAASGF